MQHGFDCTTCNTFHPFSLSALVPTAPRMLHRCPVCKAEHMIEKQVATMTKAGDPAKANPPEPLPVDVFAMFGMQTPASVHAMFGLSTPTAAPVVFAHAETGTQAPLFPALDTRPTLAPEPNPQTSLPPAQPFAPLTAVYPFDTDPCEDRPGWYEFVARMTRRDVTDLRVWWTGEDWQDGPEGSPAAVRYDAFIGWRGLLAQGG